MISVIIPAYNRLHFTVRAVESVLAQTFSDLEVVVVDDCSKEKVLSVELRNNPRVRVLRHEVNKGAAAARNTGVEAAKGEIVAFLDSDDYWMPEKLQRQMELYEKLPDRERVLIYSAYNYEMEGKWVVTPSSFLAEGNTLGDYLFIDCGDIHTSVWFGSRAIFLEFPFCLELKQHEDWDVLLRMEAAGVRFVACPIPLGVRAADLRSDRLSTAPMHAMRNYFLERNTNRLTASCNILLEAANLSAQNPQWTFLKRQSSQLSYFVASPRLTFGEKVSLLFRYAKARILTKLRSMVGVTRPFPSR